MKNKDWINRRAYPFKSHFYETAAGQMHYIDEGSGTPVVMIHGNPTWSFLYRHLIKELMPDYRCIAPDHLGFGLSDKPKDWDYLPENHAQNFSGLMEILDLKNITLVMQDWGGPIGMSYAVTHPEKVSRLIIINTWAWPVNHEPHFVAFSAFMGGWFGRLLIRRYNFFAKVLLPLGFGDRQKLSPDSHAHYLLPLAEPQARKGCHVFPKQIIASTPWLNKIEDKLNLLRDTPALIVWGMKDIAFRKKELKRWQKIFPAAKTVRLDSVGHFVQEEASEALAKAVVPFLRTTDSI